jgi:hypothetical protein
MRPLCKKCGIRPRSINYYKEDRVFYRANCDSCNKNNGVPLGESRWHKQGYRQKAFCEKCGFKSRYPEQFNVYHIDGDLTNNRFTNLKTVCANCQRVLQKEGFRWRQGHLTPDF